MAGAQDRRFGQAITITYGDCAENNVGMQRLGDLAAAGFTFADLKRARQHFEDKGCECHLIDLVAAGGEGLGATGPSDDAYLLVVRNGAAALCGNDAAADAMLAEQSRLEPDTKALMRGQVKNKLARHNLCFADESQEPDYPAGKGRVVAFKDVPVTNAVRAALPEYFGPAAAGMFAEGNYYWNPAKCGIGFHGDSERRKVVAVRLGAQIPLHFQWFRRFKPVGHRIAVSLNHGDIYAMSEKTVGTDWRMSSILTLRHAAGAKKYLDIPDA